MSYRGRAIGLLLVGSIATGVALWQQTLQGIAPEGIILAGATILLSGSLLFRAYYRGARLSRVAVAFGVVALGAWFFLSRGHESLVTLEGDWQSWAPASTHMTFGLLALLSLMAFMDSSTRGGAHVWAGALLVLYAVHIGYSSRSEVWPLMAPSRASRGPPSPPCSPVRSGRSSREWRSRRFSSRVPRRRRTGSQERELDQRR